MKLNEFDELIYDAFLHNKFEISVLVISDSSATYYKRRGFRVFKSGDIYKISWLSPQIFDTKHDYTVNLYDHFTAEHLYMTLTHNNDIRALTPNVVKQKLLKFNIVKDLFSVYDKTIISLYGYIIDELLLKGKQVYLTDGVISLYATHAHSIVLSFPVQSMYFIDDVNLTDVFINT